MTDDTLTVVVVDDERPVDPKQFVRVSRSALVRLDAIRRASPLPNGSYMLLLTNRSSSIDPDRSSARNDGS